LIPVVAKRSGASMPITIFTAGGTIDKVYFDSKGGYQVGAPMVRRILADARADEGVTVVEFLKKDSLEMSALIG
jgi:L-asparaginase